MKKILVWDIAVRVFHWLLTVTFLAAFIIAISIDDDANEFSLHSLFGLMALSVVILRLLWSFFGTKHARMSSLVFSPHRLIKYIVNTLKGSPEHYAGHNPGSAYAAIAMLFLIVGITGTGLLQANGIDAWEEVHSVLAYCMLGVVVIHLIGITLYTIQHKQFIALSMLTGKKFGQESDESIQQKLLPNLLFVVLCFGWLGGLVSNYDSVRKQVTLPVVGTTLSLGEAEGEVEQGDSEQDNEDDD